MDSRRLQKMGRSTLVVSLPRSWIERTGLHKGSLVEVRDSAEGGLLIFPSGLEEGSAKDYTIRLDTQHDPLTDSMTDEIMGAYLVGMNTIRIESDAEIPTAERSRILGVVRGLAGLEVVDENSNEITAQFLLDIRAVQPQVIMKRMSSLVRGMVADVFKTSGDKARLSTTISDRDSEVNRMYFLSVRLVRAASLNPRLASAFGLRIIDCLDYRVAAISIENTGDTCIELERLLGRGAKTPETLLRFLDAVRTEVDALQESTLSSLIERDYMLSKRALGLYDRLMRTTTDFRERHTLSPGVLRAIELTERILMYQRDIADLVSPSPRA
jgi:phosphate uptake regulator